MKLPSPGFRAGFLSFLTAAALAFAGALTPGRLGADEVVAVGKGSYATAFPPGTGRPPTEISRVDSLTGPMPTNDWWSSAAWMPFSERQYPHPLAVQAEPTGLRVYYPGLSIHANDSAIFGFMEPNRPDDLTIGHSACDKFAAAKVAGFSDWFVTLRFEQNDARLDVLYGHGSPYVYATVTGGQAEVRFPAPLKVWSSDNDAILGVTISGRHYGLFGPAGSKWSGAETATLTLDSPKHYFAVAILPDDKPETLARFAKYAHVRPKNSRVAWSYDEATGEVATEFRYDLESLEGAEAKTLFALYPHQAHYLDDAPSDGLLSPTITGQAYASVRGPMPLAEGGGFRTKRSFPGALLALPKTERADAPRMAKLHRQELAIPESPPKDTYWEGKDLGKLATIVPIAEAFGEQPLADEAVGRLKRRLEDWFAAGEDDRALFRYDERWGTLIGYPASYGSDADLNDHHFHYGYFLRAAGEVARHDRAWAEDSAWGGMVEMLIRDVASTDRDDPLFPFLRNFDPYAGHSWASGHAKFGDGNNNESSSEAMNAWYGLMLWGEATGNRELRDLGAWLFTTEATAIEEYWFDVHDRNHPPEYRPSVVTMVWGGKGANGTWFSGDPEMIHGINWLPVHAGSLYLGRAPAYAEKNYQALLSENGGAEWSAWQDVIWMYRALSDAEDARRQYQASGPAPALEAGNSAANLAHWLASLSDLGRVDTSRSADWPWHAVFLQKDVRTYAASNPSPSVRTVTFSDGTKLTVEPGDTKTLRKPAL
jgi:endoglucanase Acf2